MKNAARYYDEMNAGLHVKCPIFLSEFNETWIFSRENFEIYSNIKFNENPPSKSRIVPCGQKDGKMDRRTDGKASSCSSQSCEQA